MRYAMKAAVEAGMDPSTAACSLDASPQLHFGD
jgi:hypothetical protein